MIILDTDVLIEIIDKKSNKGEDIFHRLEDANEIFAITSISLYEIYFGLLKLKKKNLPSLSSFLVYGFQREEALLAADLELKLEVSGRKIKRTDIMIAAISISNGAVLCTFDKDFKELKDQGLKLFI